MARDTKRPELRLHPIVANLIRLVRRDELLQEEEQARLFRALHQLNAAHAARGTASHLEVIVTTLAARLIEIHGAASREHRFQLFHELLNRGPELLRDGSGITIRVNHDVRTWFTDVFSCAAHQQLHNDLAANYSAIVARMTAASSLGGTEGSSLVNRLSAPKDLSSILCGEPHDSEEVP